MNAKLAIHNGTPVRGKDDPLPRLFPREIAPEALENIKQVLDSGFTLDKTSEFQKAFAEACRTKHAVAVTNCTAAVHAAIACCDLEPGDEVIVSPISDYGSVAGVLWQNALPVFPDVDIRTGNVTAEEIEKNITPRTKAVVVVHFYGLMCDMEPIIDVVKAHNLILIEDACQTPLAEYKGRKAGSMGDMGCFSFDAEKHLSTDHGGMIITNDDDLAAKLAKFAIARGAIPKERYGRIHETLGLNYRYGNVLAAIGLAQLKRLPEQNKRRTEMAQLLTEKIKDMDGIFPPYVIPGSVPVYWLYFVRFELEKFKASIWELGNALAAEGIPDISPAPYYLIPESHTFLVDRTRVYGNSHCPFECPRADLKLQYSAALCPNAHKHLATTLRWTWTDKFTERDVSDIATAIRKVAEYYRR